MESTVGGGSGAVLMVLLSFFSGVEMAGLVMKCV